MKKLIILAILLTPALAYSHAGGVDSEGCHTVSATGERHCHINGETIIISAPQAPIDPGSPPPLPNIDSPHVHDVWTSEKQPDGSYKYRHFKSE